MSFTQTVKDGTSVGGSISQGMLGLKKMYGLNAKSVCQMHSCKSKEMNSSHFSDKYNARFIVIKLMMTSFWTSIANELFTPFNAWTFNADYFATKVYENLKILQQNITSCYQATFWYIFVNIFLLNNLKCQTFF